MIPAQGAMHFAIAFLMGLGLGLFYGFLRPLRPRLTWLADTLFVAGAFYAWLYLGFAICRSDLRMGCVSGLFVGGFVWEMTAGRLLRGVFRAFWTGIFRPVEIFLKKFRIFLKFLLCRRKKPVTIKCNKYPQTDE